MMVYNTQDSWVFGLHPSSDILKNTTFQKLDLFVCTSERMGDLYSVGSIRKIQPQSLLLVIEVSSLSNRPNGCLPPHHLKTETDPVSEMLCSLEHRTMDKEKKEKKTVIPNNNFVLAFGRMWLRNSHLTDLSLFRTPVSFQFNDQ
jgi:hypothetical protein